MKCKCGNYKKRETTGFTMLNPVTVVVCANCGRLGEHCIDSPLYVEPTLKDIVLEYERKWGQEWCAEDGNVYYLMNEVHTSNADEDYLWGLIPRSLRRDIAQEVACIPYRNYTPTLSEVKAGYERQMRGF